MPLAAPPGTITPTHRSSRGQLATIGAVVVLVVGLFVYMAVNTGPDKGREERLHAADRRAAAAPPPTLAPTTTAAADAPLPSIALAETANPNAFVDLGGFCAGSRGTTAFELRLVASEQDGTWQSIRQTLVDGQDGWRQSVQKMSTGTAPYLTPEIERYRSGYETLIEGAQSASSAADVQRAFSEGASPELLASSQKINAAILANCGAG